MFLEKNKEEDGCMKTIGSSTGSGKHWMFWLDTHEIE